LHYWLDYLRAYAGTQYPVLVVQSQCDAAADRVVAVGGGNEFKGFRSIQVAQVSAKTDLGLEALLGMLKDSAREALRLRPAVRTGTGRIRLRQRIREMRSQHKLLDRASFDALCDEVGGISNRDAALDYLYRIGVVFYRKDLFGGQVVLDQNWALAAIYSLFDRNKILPLLRGYGRFRREELAALIWKEYSQKEQAVFLGMMVSCGICFEVQKGEYVAPELLPEWNQAQNDLLAGRLLSIEADAEVLIEYPFLHEGLLRNFLSRIGREAKDAAVYWKYGCWFYERVTDSRVLVESQWRDERLQYGAGSIRMRAWGRDARVLLSSLQQELERLPLGQRPELKLARQKEEVVMEMEKLSIERAVQANTGQQTVYVSYAWGSEDSERNKVVDELCTALSTAGWKVMRDKEQLKYGDLLSGFMKTLSRADRIIVVLSEKYLQSTACMNELYGIYQRSLGDKDEFLRHVVPLRLSDAKINTWRERVDIAKHWEAEYLEMEKNVAHLGAADLALYRTMHDWHNRIGDMLAAVSDVWHPTGFETIVQDDFAGLKEMLDKDV
jgi:internalin A